MTKIKAIGGILRIGKATRASVRISIEELEPGYVGFLWKEVRLNRVMCLTAAAALQDAAWAMARGEVRDNTMWAAPRKVKP